MSGHDVPWVLAFTGATTSHEERAAVATAASWALPDAIILSTCRRTELIGVGAAPSPSALAGLIGIEAAVRGALVEGSDAAARVFRLAAGLESSVIGEDQVLHQVRGALAARTGAVPPELGRLVEMALQVGRAARRDAPRQERSLADRALARLAEWLGGLAGRDVLIAGAGPIGQAAARVAAAAGSHVIIASRDPQRAASLAAQVHGSSTSLDAAVATLADVDGVIVALAGPWVSLAGAHGVLPATIDLSAPAAVPAAIRDRLAGRFADLDAVADGDSARSEAILAYVERAEMLVAAATRTYIDWLAGRASIPTLTTLRERTEARRQRGLARLFRRLPDLGERERQLIDEVSVQLVASVLHEPSVSLRSDPDGARARAARTLFGLELES